MKINHIALYCKDLEGMRSFFMHFFAAQSNDLYHNPRTGLRTYILSFPDGETRLELMNRPDVQEGRVDESLHLGYIHISMSAGGKELVDDLTAQLVDAGHQVLSGPRTTGDGYYESCIVGPENILIEITE
ncbi:MAG: VOC family protein [Bacteroidaceae bacterium]|nr:VOC family protein [Bacteroidaceae bacterium]